MATVTTKSTAKKKPASQDYDSSNIQVLEGVEHVRLRPGMYIGTTSSRGLHHLVYEVVDNSVDEAMAGRATKIIVTLHADGSVSVQDDGAGIPVKPIPRAKDRRPAVEVALTTLNAGGKFGGGGYSISGGLHGVGVSVVNALSAKMTADVLRDGFAWHQEYAQGRSTTKLTKGKASTKHGTTIRFWPDPEIFTETTEFKREQLAERLRELAFLNAGLEIHLIDEREDPVHKDVYRYNDGLKDFVKYLNGSKEVIHKPIAIEQKGDDEVEVAMQWNTGYTESVYSFANTINTHEGGMHEEGLKKSLTNVINRYARAKGLVKEKEENLIGEDVREGLTAIISVKLRDPQFEGQTKTKLGNASMRSLVETTMNAQFSTWMEEHPADAKRIVAKAIAARQGADGGATGARPHPPQVVPGIGVHAGQARRLSADGPRGVRAVHRRGRLGRRFGARAPGTVRRRPSCRSAARSSTSRRRACTRRSRTWRSRRSSPRSARGSATSSTSRRRAITAS